MKPIIYVGGVEYSGKSAAIKALDVMLPKAYRPLPFFDVREQLLQQRLFNPKSIIPSYLKKEHPSLYHMLENGIDPRFVKGSRDEIRTMEALEHLRERCAPILFQIEAAFAPAVNRYFGHRVRATKKIPVIEHPFVYRQQRKECLELSGNGDQDGKQTIMLYLNMPLGLVEERYKAEKEITRQAAEVTLMPLREQDLVERWKTQELASIDEGFKEVIIVSDPSQIQPALERIVELTS